MFKFLLVGVVSILGGLAGAGRCVAEPTRMVRIGAFHAESESSQRADQTTVSIPNGLAAAAGEVVLPLSLSNPGDVPIGAIDISLRFPKALLTFEKIEPGGIADSVDAVVQGEVKAASGSDDSVLHVSLSTIASGGSRQAIPAGPVAYLSFKIATTAKADTKIELTLEVDVRTTDDPPRAVSPVVASIGEITVAADPVFACFFYMH